MAAPRYADVDAYVASFPADVQASLEELRSLIHTRLPGAGEKISYQIPTITLDGAAVLYFAAWKKHLSLYPVPQGDAAFERDIAPHRAAKDSVHFDYDQPLPRDEVARTVALLHERHTTQSAG